MSAPSASARHSKGTSRGTARSTARRASPAASSRCASPRHHRPETRCADTGERRAQVHVLVVDDQQATDRHLEPASALAEFPRVWRRLTRPPPAHPAVRPYEADWSPRIGRASRSSGPQDKATFESDVFSVGCLAWLVLTGQHPAATLPEREERIKSAKDGEGGLRPSAVRADLAERSRHRVRERGPLVLG